MRSLLQPASPEAAPAATRLILLPGAYHTPEDLIAQGFGTRVSERRLAVDLEFVDVEMAHLTDRRGVQELHEGVVMAARRAGCSAVWLVGISLGGFIAMHYAATRPRAIDGLCLLAPYLGNRMLLGEIAAAPGVAAWDPGEVADDDEERRIWRFAQAARSAGAAPAPPPIFLGFGREDRFALGHRLLAAALPPGSVQTIAGGHDWPVWLELWENFLDATFL